MSQSKSELRQAHIEKIVRFAKNNRLEELRESIRQLKIEHADCDWYLANQSMIAGAARDAIIAGHEDIVRLLLDEGLPVGSDADIEDTRNVRPLFLFAVKTGKLSMVQLFVEYGAKIYFSERVDDRDEWNRDYGLRTAVKEGYADIVDYLLECGADANGLCGGGTLGEMYGGTTLLANAAMVGDIRIVESLIKHGANIQNTILLAHEKIYKHQYLEHDRHLKNHYRDADRVEKFRYAFHISFEHQMDKSFFVPLNEILSDVSLLKNNEPAKEDFLRVFSRNLLDKYSIRISDLNPLKTELNRLLNALEEFDTEKRELQQKVVEFRESYQRIVRTCLDYAMGCDFRAPTDELSFLDDLDVSGMNFIGVSKDGKPITREILERVAKSGACHALITTYDLRALEDEARKNALMTRLESAFEKNGRLIYEDGIVNLVPLCSAITKNDVRAVKARIAALVDPNLEKKSPLNIAAKYGNVDIVRAIYEAHVDHTTHQISRLSNAAKQFVSGHPELKCLSISAGKVQPIALPFSMENCLVIVPENKRLTTVMRMIKRYGLETINRKIQPLIDKALTHEQNIMIVVDLHGAMRSIEYPNRVPHDQVLIAVNQQIKLTYDLCNYFPVIFMNKTNLGVIETLIHMQYKQLDIANTAVIEAIETARQQGHSAIVEFLADKQDVNTQDKDGNTLLHKAVETGDIERVRALILKNADVNLKNKHKATPLSIAARHSGNEWRLSEAHAEIVQILLDKGANPNDYDWISPLALAVSAGNPRVVALLMPVTAKIDLATRSWDGSVDPHGKRAPWYRDMMFKALNQEENIALLTLLKGAGADFNAKEDDGDTLLNHAIHHLPSFTDISHTMLDLRLAGYGAERLGNTLDKAEEQLLIRSNERFNQVSTLLDFLFANGADPRISGRNGQTPLALLIEKKDLGHLGKAAEILMDKFVHHGADVNVVDVYGNSPLHEAAHTGDCVAIDYLLNHGAVMNAQNKSGATPLHLAAARGNKSSTKLLLDRGADYTLKQEEGLTPLEFSKQAMVSNKSMYKFSSEDAERKFERKYIETQSLLSIVMNDSMTHPHAGAAIVAPAAESPILRQMIVTELVRQRASVYDTASTPREEDREASFNFLNSS